MRSLSLRPIFLFLLCSVFSTAAAQQGAGPIEITSGKHLLGIPGQPEWEEFEGSDPIGREWSRSFSATSNDQDHTLFIRQDDVKKNWRVQLNGQSLGSLYLMEAPLVHALRVPPGALKDGENRLLIRGPDEPDNIRVGPIRLIKTNLAAAVRQSQVNVHVADAESGASLPCRLTIVDQHGALAPIVAPESEQKLAVRPGVVYTPSGRASVGLPAGRYTFHVTRGFEYGLDSHELRLEQGEIKDLTMEIRREVDTRGWISCDTHIHTYTHSGHGDATIEERVVTLAGEGIELPVATDHNYLTSLEASAQRMGVREWFTPVIGDEVTTRQAHFNVFPIEPDAPVPAYKFRDWSRLFQNFHSTPGVQVVVLNHPENIHNGFRPFSPEQFNRVTGASRGVMEYGFNAIELVNSSAQQSDFMSIYEGWFALLNRGHRVVGVGSSDGHDVSRYIVGQGRTYIRGDDGDPSNLSVESTLENLLQGKASVSMGLMAEIEVNDRYGMGDLVPAGDQKLNVRVKVRGPSWTEATNLVLFANGRKVREKTISDPADAKRDGDLLMDVAWRLESFRHDVHLVALATGPGVNGLYWEIPRPYQRRTLEWTPRVIASTNPVRIDGDGDGDYNSPRDYAESLYERHRGDPAGLLDALEGFAVATAVQAAEVCAVHGVKLENASFRSMMEKAAPHVRDGFETYLASQVRR